MNVISANPATVLKISRAYPPTAFPTTAPDLAHNNKKVIIDAGKENIVKHRNGLLAGFIAGVGLTIGLAASPALAHQAPASLEGLPLLEDVASDAVQISPHVPNMGAHWARESDLPVGPIYCVIEGHVVCVEYMFTMEAFEAGTDWLALLPGIETPPISHIDVEFKAEGIEPNPVPLYQLHIYFAGTELLDQH